MAPSTEASAARERHHIGPRAYGVDYCDMDGTPWPCDTATVLAALDAAIAERDAAFATEHGERVVHIAWVRALLMGGDEAFDADEQRRVGWDE